MTTAAVWRCCQDAFGDKKKIQIKSLYSKQFVQEAVLQCVQRLSEQQPDVQVGLITFNHQVYTRSPEAWSKDNCPVFAFEFFFVIWFCLLSFFYIWFNFQFLIYDCKCRMQVITVAFLHPVMFWFARWRCMDMTISRHVSYTALSWPTSTIWKRLPRVSPVRLHCHRPRTTYRDKFRGRW